MFKNIEFTAIIAVASVASMVYYSMTVLWPTIISSVYTTDVMAVGWQSSVIGGGILLGQIIGGFAISYVPKVRYQCIVASCFVLSFTAALASLDESRWAETIAFGVVATCATGFIDNIAFPGVTLLWEPQDIGLATGILGSVRGLAGAIAQALYISLYTSKLAAYTPEYVTSAATGAGLAASSLPALYDALATGNFTAVPGITPAIEGIVADAVLLANTNAFRFVFYITIPFSACLLVAACFVPNFEKYLSKNVAKRLQNSQFRRKLEQENFEEKPQIGA